MSATSGDEQQDNSRKINKVQYMRQRLRSFNTFLNYFYEEQKETPWQFLIGPGPSHQTSYALTHVWYMFIISFIPVCSMLTGISFLESYFARDSSFCDWVGKRQSCESVIVLFVTYRIGFSVATFFLFTSFILLKSSRVTNQDPSTASTKITWNLHNGFWIEKILIVLGLSCVTFSFPTSSFDEIWLGVVLCGDNLLSCIQLFLLMDMVVATHSWLQKRIISKKNTTLTKFLLLFVEIFIPVSIIINTSVLSFFNAIQSARTCVVGLVTAIAVVSMVCCVIVTVLVMKPLNFLISLYACAYATFLLYKAVYFRKNTCKLQNIVSDDNIIPPNVKTWLSLCFLYVTCIYGLLRTDSYKHYYYFYWVIASGTAVVDRHGQHRHINTSHRDRSVRHGFNPNETLLDVTMEPCEQLHRNFEELDQTSKEKKICYAESFIHLFLLLVTLKSVTIVTNYHVLKETSNIIVMVKPIASSLSLYSSGLSVLFLYSWTVYVSIYEENINSLSVKILMKTLFKFIGNFLYVAFVKPPRIFQNTSLYRYMYTGLYFICFVASCFAISPTFRHHADPISFFCSRMSSFGLCMAEDPTYIRLCRFLAAPGILFFTLGIISHGIKSITSPRIAIQNGCWLLKILFLILVFTLLSNIPNQFGRIWLYTSMIMMYIFTLLQLVCLLDFVGIINSSCHHTKKMSSNTVYYSTSSLATFLYVISMAAFVCFYVYYAHNFHCKVTRLFISINLVLCISSSVISIHPAVISGGLLKSAMVTSWCMYLTWSALNYNPNEKCNPLAHNLMTIEAKPSRDAVSLTDIFFLVITLIYYTRRIEYLSPYLYSLWPNFLFRCKNNTENTANTTENDVIVTLNKNYEEYDAKFIQDWLENCYEKSTTNDKSLSLSLYHKQTFREKLLFGESSHINSYISNTPTRTIDSRDLSIPYDFTMLHYVYGLSTCYTFVLLTHWLEPIPGSSFKITVHWSIMSVKMLASCTTVLLYIWTLVITVLKNSQKK